MCLTVADVDGSVTINKDTMRASRSAFKRIAIGAVSSLSVSDENFEAAGGRSNDAD